MCIYCDESESEMVEYRDHEGYSAFAWVGESHLVLHSGKNEGLYGSIRIAFCPFCGEKLEG